MIICAVYSVSQVRIIEEFIHHLPAGEKAALLSFNDAQYINDQLRNIATDLEVPFYDLNSFCYKVRASDVRKEFRSRLGTIALEGVKLNRDYCKLLARQRVACRLLIQSENASCVVVCEDGPGGCGPLIAEAKELGVPVIDMPFGIGEKRDYEMYLENRAAGSMLYLVPDNSLGEALRKHGAHWIWASKYGDVTLLSPESTLARIVLGIDIPKPWVVHGGDADILCVESVAMQRIYEREGVDPKKQVMTGSCYADVIYRELHSEPSLLDAYNNCDLIDPDRPRILVALPPSYHRERKGEFGTYSETIERIISGCRSAHPNAIITVSIHPATEKETVELIKKYVDEVSKKWLLRLIPRHDVFITTASSTIRWAILARKPVINYDMYGFDFKTYDMTSSVCTTNSLNKALDYMSEILLTPMAYHAASLSMAFFSEDWGGMDGKNFERIWSEIDRRRSMAIPVNRGTIKSKNNLMLTLKRKLGLND